MLPVQRIKAALHFQELDRPPHFEQIFELTEEAFGVAMPSEEEIAYAHGRERNLLFEKCANLYAMTIKRFSWDAVLIWRPAMVKPADVADHHSYMFIPYLKEYLRSILVLIYPLGPLYGKDSFLWMWLRITWIFPSNFLKSQKLLIIGQLSFAKRHYCIRSVCWMQE